jgi:hypothetical protein
LLPALTELTAPRRVHLPLSVSVPAELFTVIVAACAVTPTQKNISAANADMNAGNKYPCPLPHFL